MAYAFSSPSPSPNSLASQEAPLKSTMDLTPRSKVQAMLAAIDDETSDKENQSLSIGQVSSNQPTTNLPLAKPIAEKSPTYNQTFDEEESATPMLRKSNRSSTHPSVSWNFHDHESLNVDERTSPHGNIPRASLSPLPLRRSSSQTSYTGDNRNPGVAEDNVNDLDSLADSEQTPKRKSIRRIPPPTHYSTPPPPKDTELPTLFVSPQHSHMLPVEQATVGQTSNPLFNSPKARLKALVARKREEKKQLEVRDQEPTETDISTPSSSSRGEKQSSQTLVTEAETADNRADRDMARRLTQQARPTRKASKKALEEMNRETQRMSRNMQLTHEARTKTKFTTKEFLAKFRYGQANALTTSAQLSQQPNPLSSSAPTSPHAENAAESDTPPSSPPSIDAQAEKPGIVPSHGAESNVLHGTNNQSVDDDEEELLDLKELLSQKSAPTSPEQTIPTRLTVQPSESKGEVKRYSVRRFAKSVKTASLPTSDDELEIVDSTAQKSFGIFESLPKAKAKEAKPLHNLRLLAHVSGYEPTRKGNQRSISVAELEKSLRQRARKQAKDERDEKIRKLKEKGIIVMTAEEKEREQMQLDSMLEKARKDAQELAKREKEAAKQNGENMEDNLDDSDDEDGDYVSGEDADEEDLSGSEDEADADGENLPLESTETDGAAQVEAEPGSIFVEEEASDDGPSDDQSDSDDGNKKDIAHPSEKNILTDDPSTHRTRKIRKRVILSDDEDDVDGEAVDKTPMGNKVSINQAKTPKQAAADIFGFAKTDSPALRLSQVFAGTMAESQTQAEFYDEVDEDQDSLAFLRGLPPPDLPDYTTPKSQTSPSLRITDSQQKQTEDPSQPQHSVLVRFDTETQQELDETQLSEIPDLSQDVGFQSFDSPVAMMSASYSTIDTVPIDFSPEKDIENVRRKRRLMRKGDGLQERRALHDNSEPHPVNLAGDQTVENFNNAFKIMQTAAQTSNVELEFNKKNSEAKGMVEEQAEESEDEYAGLGGASDDDSDGEADEDTKNIIDDEDKAATDGRDIAAYFAEKERLDDEKGIEKLYKDVINGGLRRKRGAEHDLWESDDEDEIVARRRAAKQREFAKMRKALLADEKLGKIAQNPKQEAFLQTIEDRTSSEEQYLLDAPDEELSQIPDSQGKAASPIEQVAEPTLPAKRKHIELEHPGETDKERTRPPPALRRAGNKTRPTTLAEIRNTLSEIIGEPDSILENAEPFFESPPQSDNEESAFNHRLSDADAYADNLYDSPTEMPPPPKPVVPHNPRRTGTDPARVAVVDRMALKRSGSTSSSSSSNSGGKLAFQALGRSNSTGSRVPSLLRRATTNGSIASTSSSETNRSVSGGSYGGLGGKENVKMGGSKKSSINYHVREQERRARIEQVEKERKQGQERVGKLRRTTVISGFGTLVGGNFE